MKLHSLNYRIGTFIRKRGFLLLREYREPLCTLNLLELAVRAMQGSQPSLTIVQIGAFDGDTLDPLKQVLSNPANRVILVEPQPKPFAMLQEKYAGRANFHLENSAVGKEDGPIQMFIPKNEDYSLLASIDEGQIRNAFHLETRTITVNSITVPSLLRKYNIASVDVLQIDTEGYDFKLLRQFLEEGIEPSVINFESYHLSKEERLESRSLLTRTGYEFAEYGWVDNRMDTLAVKSGLLSSQA